MLSKAFPDTQDDDADDFPDIENLVAQIPLGQRLVDHGHLTPDQLRIGLIEQKNRGTMLGATLVALGFIDEETLTVSLAERAGVSSVDLDSYALDDILVKRIPRGIAENLMVVPLRLTAGQLGLAMADPFDIVALDTIRRFFPRGTDIRPRVAARSSIEAAIRAIHGRGPSVDDILREIEGSKQSTLDEHPVIRLVDALLKDAIHRGASDIHLEPESGYVRVRLRIDGRLQQIHAIHHSLWPALSHRVKIMAGMNIADTRSIQDGRFQITATGGEIDFRVAVMPTVYGETIALRLLDHRRSLLPLEELGYSASALARLKLIAAKPHGLTLVTGPTGSGKTTTLYSLLQSINTPDVHIATLEDPVEYQMDLIRQTAIQDEQGLGFAEGVRGLLRMDPDIILIGEIRDSETAQMALRAAMTGHQVYATLHCNDALGALPRLIDLGLSPSLLAGNISGIIAQRLVRTLCPLCKTAHTLSEDEQKLFPQSSTVAAEATGCEDCHGTGRQGRTVIAEVLPVTSALDDLIAASAPRNLLFKMAREDGFTTLREDGLGKVLAGCVSLQDLRRVVDLSRGAER